MPTIYPKISIITATYNSEKTLNEAITSLRAQGYPNLEYIVIDGKSSDNTLDIIKTNRDFITKWISEEDQGASDAYNKGVKNARGDLVAFLNSDDLYEKGLLHEIAKIYSMHKNADVISCGMKLIELQTGKLLKSVSSNKEIQITLHNTFFGYALMNARFFKRDLLIKHPFRILDKNNEYFITNDMYFFAELILEHTKLKQYSITKPLYIFRVHNNSLSADPKKQNKIKIEHMDMCEELFSIAKNEGDIKIIRSYYIFTISSLFFHALINLKLGYIVQSITKLWKYRRLLLMYDLLSYFCGALIRKIKQILLRHTN